MPAREVLRYPHPALKRAATAATPEQVQRVAKDVVDTMNAHTGCVGLAAPQIDEPVRLAIIEIDGGQSRYGEIPAMPLTVFVNPTIEIVDPKAAGYWEGCLSVPGLRGWVERPQFVRVSYQDLDGKKHAIELKGFLATVFQHEFDHLDGKLYIDRMTDPTKLVFEEEYLRYLSADE